MDRATLFEGALAWLDTRETTLIELHITAVHNLSRDNYYRTLDPAAIRTLATRNVRGLLGRLHGSPMQSVTVRDTTQKHIRDGVPIADLVELQEVVDKELRLYVERTLTDNSDGKHELFARWNYIVSLFRTSMQSGAMRQQSENLGKAINTARADAQRD